MLVISEDLDEVMAISDRILVIYEGVIISEVDPRTTSREEIGLMMAGVVPAGVGPEGHPGGHVGLPERGRAAGVTFRRRAGRGHWPKSATLVTSRSTSALLPQTCELPFGLGIREPQGDGDPRRPKTK